MTAAALRISYSPKILLHILCICSFTNRMCNKSTDGNNCTIMHHNILWISQIFYITFQLMKTISPSHPYAVHPHLLMLLLQNFFLIKHLILHFTNVFAFVPQYFPKLKCNKKLCYLPHARNSLIKFKQTTALRVIQMKVLLIWSYKLLLEFLLTYFITNIHFVRFNEPNTLLIFCLFQIWEMNSYNLAWTNFTYLECGTYME